MGDEIQSTSLARIVQLLAAASCQTLEPPW